MGYYRAGFDVVGIDNRPQKHYPFPFIQGDALNPPVDLSKFDAIHASPPCQRYSRLTKVRGQSKQQQHSDLVELTRRCLLASKKLFIIENVKGAPLRSSFTLCGMAFGLKVYRHRLFESNVFIFVPSHNSHREVCPSAGKGKSKNGFISVCGHQGGGVTMTEWKEAMGIDWMVQSELSQAIPPAYTEFIGKQLMEALK